MNLRTVYRDWEEAVRAIVTQLLPFEQKITTDLTAHVDDTTAAHAASAIVNTPAGNIVATTVQAALNELDSEKAKLAGAATQVFSTADLSVTGNAGLNSSAVQTYTGFNNLTISGTTAAGIIELITQTEDADAVNSGSCRWTDKNATSTDKTSAAIQVNLQGTTANNRGSKMRFYTKADNDGVIERLSIDNTGAVCSLGTLGYGTGAGGTVTQATNKITSVTLNKSCGQITMNNAALAGGAVVIFAINNNLAALGDVAPVNSSGLDSYSVHSNVGSGVIYVALKNDTAGSLSDAVVVTFSLIKGALS